jgi:hypothetical protein
MLPVLTLLILTMGGFDRGNWWGQSWGETTPSLTPYSDFDVEGTLEFTKRAGKPWLNAPRQYLRVTAYTDDPRSWTELRYRSVMRLTRWYLSRCQIEISIPPLRKLPVGTLTKDGLVRWRVSLPLTQSQDPGETLLLFTRKVEYIWSDKKGKRKYSLLGLSHHIWLQDRAGKWYRRAGAWVRPSPVFTTMVHELGHRLGLPHIEDIYSLMLTGSGVRSSPRLLWTSLLGYFDPARFRFSAAECQKMHDTLRLERKKNHRQAKP